MRPIKFKAQRVDTREWVEGDLVHKIKNVFGEMVPIAIMEVTDYPVEVDPATVCQFTGLTDKNGKEIWEGDILLFADDQTSEVRWQQGGLTVEADFDDYDITTIGWAIEILGECEVIGNIHSKAEEGTRS